VAFSSAKPNSPLYSAVLLGALILATASDMVFTPILTHFISVGNPFVSDDIYLFSTKPSSDGHGGVPHLASPGPRSIVMISFIANPKVVVITSYHPYNWSPALLGTHLRV